LASRSTESHQTPANVPGVSRKPVRRALIGETRSHWTLSIARTAFLAIVAYFVAACVYILLSQISRMPHGALWDPSFQGPFLFIMLLVAVGLLAAPFFQSELGAGVRTLSLLAAVFLVGYAGLLFTRYGDPEFPLRFVITHVFTPFRQAIGY
jgi:hypothetical protein